MSRGVDVNTVSEDGRWSGLTLAADRNKSELLEILLSHPDIKINNTATSYGPGGLGNWFPAFGENSQWTPLMFACDGYKHYIATKLVRVPGLDINYQDEYGYTAVQLSCIYGDTHSLRILAETGKVDWNRGDIGLANIPLFED